MLRLTYDSDLAGVHYKSEYKLFEEWKVNGAYEYNEGRLRAARRVFSIVSISLEFPMRLEFFSISNDLQKALDKKVASPFNVVSLIRMLGKSGF